MSNMSYCRFENTLGDLQDCRDAIESMQENAHRQKNLELLDKDLTVIHDQMKDLEKTKDEDRDDAWEEDHDELECESDRICELMDENSDGLEALSQYEYPAAVNLLELCREIADTFDEDDLIKEVTQS